MNADPHPPEWPWYSAEAIRRAQSLVARGRVFDYGHGPEIAAIEAHARGYHGREYCLALNSGTSALLAAYVGLGIGPGDEVILPTFTFLSCATPLLLLGAVPVLADSGSPTGNVTAQSLAPHITSRTRALAVTHLFGEPCDMEPIVRLARRHGLAVVEDCSHAHGARFADGSSVGTVGDAAVYSIGGVKPVSGGLGGLLLTDDEDTYDIACLLSAFKQRSRATIRRPQVRALADTGLGGNLRLSPVAAVLAQSHLDDLPEIVATKQRNAARLERILTAFPGVRCVPTDPKCDRGGRYGVHLELDREVADVDRDALVGELGRAGLLITESKTRLLHRSSLFRGERPPRSRYPEPLWRRHFNYPKDAFPVASSLHDSWLALPATRLHGDVDAMLTYYAERTARAWEALVA